MAQDLALKVLLTAQDSASGTVKGFGSTLINLAGDAGPLLGIFGGVALAAIAVGAAGVKMAADYDQSMRMVQALTGATTQQMGYYDAQVKQLAVDAGVAPTELAKGLYNVLSASYKGADAVKVLTLATEDAKIGMTSASITTDALTNILRSFGTQSKDITRVNGEMLQTVTLGKATFEQYATTIVKSASAANQFHVSMETMNAAWATMTSSGIRAAQASTDFQQSLKVMYGNIGTVVKSLEKNGIAFNETKFNAMSYGDKVQYLNTALEQANQKHVKITGVTIQAAQAIQTIAKHIDDYNSNLTTLSDKHAMAQKTQDAWAITQKGFNQTLDRAKAALDVLLIDIGQQLLPLLTKIVGAVAPAVSWLLSFAKATSQNQVAMAFLKGALIAFAGVALGILIPAFISWAAAAGAAALATLAATWPIILIGVIAAAVIGGIIIAVQHWGAISAWIKNVWGAVIAWFGSVFSALGTFFHGLWDGIVNFFKTTWDKIVSFAKTFGIYLIAALLGPAGIIVALVITHWTQIHDFLSRIGPKILEFITAPFRGAISLIKDAINFIIDQIDKFIGGINGIGIDIGPIHVHPNIPKIPHLATGGYIESTGLAIVHRGERVIPAGVNRAGGYGGGGTTINMGGIHIYVTGRSRDEARHLADEFEKELARRMRTRSNIPVMTSGGVRS